MMWPRNVGPALDCDNRQQNLSNLTVTRMRFYQIMTSEAKYYYDRQNRIVYGIDLPASLYTRLTSKDATQKPGSQYTLLSNTLWQNSFTFMLGFGYL